MRKSAYLLLTQQNVHQSSKKFSEVECFSMPAALHYKNQPEGNDVANLWFNRHQIVNQYITSYFKLVTRRQTNLYQKFHEVNRVNKIENVLVNSF